MDPRDVIDLDAVFAQRLADAGDPFDLGVALAQAQGTAEAPGDMQPGLGIPAEAVDAALASAPPALALPPTAPFLVPDDEPPAIGDELAAARPQLQPGLGIPTSTLDAALNPEPESIEAETLDVTPPGDVPGAPAPSGSEDYRREVEQLSTPDLIGETQRWETSRQQLGADRTAIELKNQIQAEANDAKAFLAAREAGKQKLAQLDVEARALADEPPPSWHEEGGIGRTIAAALMAFAGGLVQHLNNGRNLGLEMIDKAIDRHNAQQTEVFRRKKGALDDQRSAVGAEMAGAADDFDRASATRMATWKRTEALIAAEQANYDRDGTMWRQYEMARREALAREAKAAADIEAAAAKQAHEQQKMLLDVVAADRQERELAEKMRSAKADERLRGWKIAVDKADAVEGRKIQREQIDAQAKALEASGNKEAAKLLRERAIGGEQYEIKDADGKVVGVGRRLVTQADGSTFIPQGTDGEVAKLRDTKAATDFVVDVLDRVRRRRTGWTSDFAKSAENQQLKADWAAATVIMKDVLGLGALSGPDKDLIDNFLGSDNPTEWRDPTPAIESARGNALGIYNARARTLGATKEYNPPDTAKYGKAKAVPGDTALREVLGDLMRDMSTDRVAAELGASRADTAGNMSGLARKLRAAGGMLPSTRAALDGWKSALKSSDPTIRKRASENLTQAANKSQQQAVRKYASSLLAGSIDVAPDTDEDTGQRVTGTTPDSSYGAPTPKRASKK